MKCLLKAMNGRQAARHIRLAFSGLQPYDEVMKKWMIILAAITGFFLLALILIRFLPSLSAGSVSSASASSGILSDASVSDAVSSESELPAESILSAASVLPASSAESASSADVSTHTELSSAGISTSSSAASVPSFTTDQFLEQVAEVYRMAHDGHYVYGDSKSTPPCSDGTISCDRLIARALWNLGLQDQPAGGFVITGEEAYLTSHGFTKVTDQSQLTRGDIVMQDSGHGGDVDWTWHTFVLLSYDPATTKCLKYDCGHFTPEGADRISSIQPFDTVLADYGNQRNFYCGFHLSSE
jgi:hypothetical protein